MEHHKKLVKCESCGQGKNGANRRGNLQITEMKVFAVGKYAIVDANGRKRELVVRKELLIL